MLLCKSKKVIRRKGAPFPESELSCFGQKKTFIDFIQTLLLHLLFFVKPGFHMSGKSQTIGYFTVFALS